MHRLSDFEPLLPAEQKLVDAAETGERVVVGDGELPEKDGQDVEVRAGLIRMLLLGSDPTVRLHEKSVRLRGAIILDKLDMQGCECRNDLTLSRCRLEAAPSFVNARLHGLVLSGCRVPGISADNAVFDGSVFLRSGLICTGEIALPGAKITGDLQICDVQLSSDTSDAIFAPSLKVEGSVYLGDYPYDDTDSELTANGPLIFSSAVIGGDFFCRFASISPEGGLFANLNQDGTEGEHHSALSLARADIGGVLFLKDNQISQGIVNLSGAIARRLNDEPVGSAALFPIRLDGFEYHDFAQHTDTTVRSRLSWLERRPEGIEFRAQPYEHLARTLNKIGHRDDARDVLMRKEYLQRRANIKQALRHRESPFRIATLVTSDFTLRHLVGYGYRPIRVLVWALLMMCAVAAFFELTWRAGDMAPNAAPVLVSRDWIAATESHPENPGAFWSSPGQAGQDYETFNALAYAADLMIPIVNLGQEDAWAPSTSRSTWGQNGWWLRWVAKLFGWVFTALGAAAVTGLIRRD